MIYNFNLGIGWASSGVELPLMRHCMLIPVFLREQ